MFRLDRRRIGVVALLLLATTWSPTSNAATCEEMLPQTRQISGGPRPLQSVDLLRLRNLGSNGEMSQAPMFSLSPDKQSIALVVRRANLEANDYCQALIVVPLTRGGAPKIIDDAGAPIRTADDFRGKAGFPTGIAKVITPHWLPDGRQIAYLKRLAGTTQVWMANVATGISKPLTHATVDVEDLAVSPDGRSIVYSTRPALATALAQIDREGRAGFLYDDRYAPGSSNRPFPRSPVPLSYSTFDLTTGKSWESSIPEIELLTGRSSAAPGTLAMAHSVRGWNARIEVPDGQGLPLMTTLSADNGRGLNFPCNASACAGRLVSVFWSTSGNSVFFMRREGWASASTAIYAWMPGKEMPRRIFLTDDILADCQSTGVFLICAREGSTRPREIVEISVSTGKLHVLFNPNPEFQSLRLGKVERLHWKNSFGIESLGDLVLPVGYQEGRSYPLIVVQYDTRGFLRGGTGDEYPIQRFANLGFAVLSVSRPRDIGVIRGAKSINEAEKLNLEDFADRKSALSTVETGVAMLVTRGVADPRRIGITGFSDGASTVQFALLHSTTFSAVAMSQCCWDPSLPLRVGPGAMRDFIAQGYPRLVDEATAFWSQISLARNAATIRVPILLQIADTEYMSSLESFTALREVDAPIEMYVFPDEQHVKWQPVHRLAIYERSVDWFAFWFQDKEGGHSDRSAEFRRWEALEQASDRLH